ncbi:hypothetical protein V6Z11_D05G072000 [Gossypium hirsutum]
MLFILRCLHTSFLLTTYNYLYIHVFVCSSGRCGLAHLSGDFLKKPAGVSQSL